ncbi:MAG: hypothetical protein ACOCQD_04350 [archaeon]
MPRCQTCTNYFPPKLTVVMNEALGDHQCVFCKAGKEHLTIVDEKTGKEDVITKAHIIEEYQKYIKELYNSRKIQNIINPDSKSNIIKP